MDKGFPKQVDETFLGMTSKVTAALQQGGEQQFRLEDHWNETMISVFDISVFIFWVYM